MEFHHAGIETIASRQTVYRIMHHIDTHLHEKLTLDELSAAASYSPYHFHRVFKSIAGMTPGSYILERRMCLVKRYLDHHSRLTMTEIAERAGFTSASDFSRAFKGRFGETPTAYRANRMNRKICITDRKIYERYFNTNYYNRSQESGRSPLEPVRTLKVTIKRMPQYRVVYLPLLGSASEEMLLQQLTGAFREAAASAANRLSPSFQSLMIGSSHELSLMLDGVCRYRIDVCAAVPDTIDDQRNLPITDLPGGLYATVRVSTRLEEILAVMDAFYHDWLPASGYRLGEGPSLVVYGSAAAFQHGYPPIADCCIPIVE